ncbi:MAG: maltose acetyltransferase domain-containing protein [Bifidobacterium catenulatum]
MVSGQWYQDSHPEIERKRAEAKRLFCAYNALSYDQEAERREILTTGSANRKLRTQQPTRWSAKPARRACLRARSRPHTRACCSCDR